MSSDARSDVSSELVSELRAIVASGNIFCPVDDRKVRSAVEDITEAYEHMQSILTNPYVDRAQLYYASSIMYYRAKCIRVKRCLLTYLLWRQRQLSRTWWMAQDTAMQSSMSSAEKAYLDEYDSTMVEYMTSFPVPIDLRAFTWRPPSFQQLEIRGLKNHLFVSPITGNTISIYVGEQINLGFEEAEMLIQQKIAELVSS